MTLLLHEEIMDKILRVILAVATLLTALGTLGLGVYALTIAQWGLFATCLLLTGGFGFFVYRDYKFFFGDKGESSK